MVLAPNKQRGQKENEKGKACGDEGSGIATGATVQYR